MSRVYLMADRGDGPEVIAEWFEPAHSPRTLQTAGAERCGSHPHWLVEAESADAARACIAAFQQTTSRTVPYTFTSDLKPLGRILASGGAA